MALLVAAIACVVVGVALLRTLGTRYRVGRLLAAAPAVSLEQTLSLAHESERYVRITGRISSEEEFPDEIDRPLVYRRKRIEVGDGRGRWRTIADEREAVPFGIQERSALVAIDVHAINDGLVAIPRISDGKFSDLPADLTAHVSPRPADDAPARLVVEQLSAVEHATACGTPIVRDGRPMLSAGAGRPLIVTTLDAPSAMRLLASGNRRRVIAAAILLIAAGALVAASVVSAILGV